MQFYWDLISKDTIAEGAHLHFQRKPAEFRCQECRQSYVPDINLTCPGCGSANVTVVTGEEFFLNAIDIED